MSRIKIKMVSIGHLPLELSIKKIEKWESELFEIVDTIENYELRCDSDGPNWEFSDTLIQNILPEKLEADFLIAIVNVPLENNWYSRRLGDSSIVFTYHEIKEILQNSNIPLENIIYRLLYAYSLVYLRADNKIPDNSDDFKFTHDETRGCLFDMNGIKTDVVASCSNPIICSECQEKSRSENVSNDKIKLIQKEIKNIKKDMYYRILDFIKNNPIHSLLISSLFALVIGVLGSIIGSYIYGKIGVNEQIKYIDLNNSIIKMDYEHESMLLSMELYAMEKPHITKQKLDGFLERYPNRVNPYVLYYDYYIKLNDMKSAEIILNKCINNITPKTVEEYYKLSKILYDNNINHNLQKKYIEEAYIERNTKYTIKENIEQLYRKITNNK